MQMSFPVFSPFSAPFYLPLHNNGNGTITVILHLRYLSKADFIGFMFSKLPWATEHSLDGAGG